MAKRTAVIVAASVEVQCPYCGEPQPSPRDGSFVWELREVSAAQGIRACVSCDEPFRIVTQSRVSAEGW